MRSLGYFFGAIIIVAAIFTVILTGPSGLYNDDGACLYNGKFILTHPLSIISALTPAELKEAPKFERVFWVYYRPVERLGWALVFFFFGLNTILIGFLQKILFLCSLYLIYRIGWFLSSRLAGMIAVMVFVFTPLTYGLLLGHAWLAAQLGLLFGLSGVYFTLRGIRNSRALMVCAGILLVALSILSRESNLYIYCGILSPYIIDYARMQPKCKTKNLSMTFIYVSFVLICLLYGCLFIKTPIYSSVGLELHQLAPGNINSNINFYGSEIYGSWNALFIGICLYLLFIFRAELQFAGLIWALVGLIPLLFSRFIAKTYLFNFFVGFSLFCGAGLSLLVKHLGEKLHDSALPFSARIFSKNTLKHAFILIIGVLSLLFSATRNLKGIYDSALIARYNLSCRQKRIKYIENLGKNDEIFVSRKEAKEFFTVILKIIGRNDVTIKVIDSWKAVEELVIGDNLLKNPSFENNLEYWERINDKGKKPGLVELTQDHSFALGKQALLVDASVLRGDNYNLVDVAQLVKLQDHQEYIFGGIVKLMGFKEGLRFEVGQRGGFQNGFWRTDIKSGNNNWQVLFNSFTLTAKQREVFFYAVRAENLVRGKAYIDGVFIYKTKKPILGYD